MTGDIKPYEIEWHKDVLIDVSIYPVFVAMKSAFLACQYIITLLYFEPN